MSLDTAVTVFTVAQAIESISRTNPQLYGDLAQPSVQKLGAALSTVANLLNTALTPIELINETVRIKKEQFLKEYEEKICHIPEEKICNPNFAVIGPMVERVKYKITEDELRQKYATLIASASNSDNLMKPLLSFHIVLDQMSPRELQLLKHVFPTLPDGMANNIPISDIKLHSGTGYTFPFKNVTGIQFNNMDFQTITLLLSNLERLGLIYIDKENYTEPVLSQYKYILDSDLFKELNRSAEEERNKTHNPWPRYEIRKGHFSLTDFGISFVQTLLL